MTLRAALAVKRENQRLVDMFGSDYEDWLTEVAENAIENWTDEKGNLDEESVLAAIEDAADDYEYFRRHND